MDENLSLLAEKLGIDRCFSDAGLSKKNYEVSDDVVKFFCKGAASPCPGRQECHAKLIKENEEPAGYRPFFTENQAGSALFFLYWDGMMPNFL